jgi:deoxyribonuclease-4
MRIGGHVSTSGGIQTALDRGQELGCDAIQIFSQSPRMWRPTNHTDEALDGFAARRKKLRLPVAIHALYLINLATADRDMARKSVDALASSCDVAARIGAESVIVHVGSHLGEGLEPGLKRVCRSLGQVLKGMDDSVWLLLENTAGTGATIGRTIGELATITDRCDHPRLGLCLDSCHLYASGVDVSQPEAVEAMLDEIDASMGLQRVRALHLNDSQTPLGSNRDRHANIGEGMIGNGMASFLGAERLQGLPCLLETPGKDGKGTDRAGLDETRRLWRLGRRRARARARA